MFVVQLASSFVSFLDIKGKEKSMQALSHLFINLSGSVSKQLQSLQGGFCFPTLEQLFTLDVLAIVFVLAFEFIEHILMNFSFEADLS